jgi:RimJ/RimL family protein N-acetyltransferase
MIFATRRLIARRLDVNDLNAFVAMRNDPEVARYQSWESFSESEGHQFLSDMSGQQLGEPGWFQFALEDRVTASFVGDCALNIQADDRRLAQIGYSVARPFWSCGYATEAVTELVDFAFRSFSLQRISASADPRNKASCRVLEKAGFRKEAHFRQNIWFKGSWADDVTYAILRSDRPQDS